MCVCAGNLTGWVAFRLEDIRETEGEKQHYGRKQQKLRKKRKP